jgi:hypothetical protein
MLSGQLAVEPVAVRLEDLAAQLNTYDVDFADVGRPRKPSRKALSTWGYFALW